MPRLRSCVTKNLVPETGRKGLSTLPVNLDDLDHALRNPLMIMRGHAALIQHALAQQATLTATEISRCTRDLAAIDATVLAMAAILDELHAQAAE